MVNPFLQAQPYSGTGWVFTGTPGFPLGLHYQTVSPGNSRCTVNGTRVGTNDCGVQDLTDVTRLNGPISDTNWRLRVNLFWNGANSFRNTDVAFEGSNTIDVILSDSDQTFNSSDNQKYAGIRISNFDGNNPTPLIRAGGPNGYRGLARCLWKNTAAEGFSANFTPGGQPQNSTNTSLEVIRAGTVLTINLYDSPTFQTLIETQVATTPIPAGVTGLKFLKLSSFDFNNPNASTIQGFLTTYEILSGEAAITGKTSTTSLISKLYGGT